MTTNDTSTGDERMTEAAALQRIAQWSDISVRYDAARPSAPVVIPPLLAQLAETSYPSMVVDLGCGTGLSTLVWLGAAREVVGVEPNDDMRQQAERRAARIPSNETQARFIAATAQQTGLPDACADIVTASQAFHWMEPVSTLAEIARILRPGGVFAAYDYQWPPTIAWQTDTLFHSFTDRAFRVAAEHGVQAALPGWEKVGHLDRMRASGHFRQVKEITLHNVEQGDADRFIDLAMSNVVEGMLARGEITPDEIDLEAFERAAREAIPAPLPWYVSYYVRLGVK